MNYRTFISKWLKGRGFASKCLKFAFISLFLGSFALTLSLSVLEGFHTKILELAFKYDSHIKITTFTRSFFDLDGKISNILDNEIGNYKAEPILEAEVLTDANKKSEIFRFKSMSPNALKKSFNLSQELKSDEVSLSENTAKKLDLKLGDPIVLFYKDLNNNNSRLKVKKFFLGEIFKTGFAEVDDNLLLLNLESARDLLRLDDSKCNSIEIWLEKPPASRELIKKLESGLGYPYFVRRAEDIHFMKIAWIEVQKQPIPIVLALITLVAVSNIVSAMLVLILEKFKSIGLMRAMGMSKRQLLNALIYRGLKLGFVGSLSGSVFAILLGSAVSEMELIKLPATIYFVEKLPIKVLPLHLIAIISTSVILSLLAAVIPGFIAMRFSPIRAIRGVR